MTESVIPQAARDKSSPVGVVLVFIDDRGNSIAHAADFKLEAPGGFKLIEGQRLRARRQLAVNVYEAYSSPMLTRAIDFDDAERVVQKLCQKYGCHVHEIVVGHTND